MKTSKNVFNRKKFFIVVLISFFLFTNIFTINKASATVPADIFGGPTTVIRKITDFLAKKKDDWLKKIGTNIFQTTLSTVLNKLAYDAATYIGSGGEGQSELFTTEYLTDFAKDAGNAAFGSFVDSLSKDWGVDVCQPTGGSDAKAKIGLGLVAFNEPEFADVNCDFQKLVSNWSSEVDRWKSFKEPDYLSMLSNSFSPTGNDIMLTMVQFDKAEEAAKKEEEKQAQQVKLNNGWLDVRNIGGNAETTPGQAKDNLQQAKDLQTQNLGKYTGEAALDAVNIFLNQLAITGFNKILSSLGEMVKKGDATKTNFSSTDTDVSSSKGKTYLVGALKSIIKPKFNVAADIDILSTLMMCNDTNNPAPNNCVIDNNFSQAIQNKNTVIQAIDNGYLNGDWTFDDDKDYQSGFNYRSLVILKKFRIVPLGWEEASIRAKEKSLSTGYKYTLKDMVSCFDPTDEYSEFSSGFINSNFSSYSWCEGLIDPNWVLKAPLGYCKKQGYGGYIQTQQLIDIPESAAADYLEEMDPIIISRSGDYCADEQSCIKEKADGSCEYYGYCTEDKRSWNFGENSCDAVYNTCESFTSASNGKQLALLKNTIDYGTCTSDTVGCARYALSGKYDSTLSKVIWNNTNSIYLNGKASTCSESNEGCQELIRTVSGGGHNFLLNASFEYDLNNGLWAGLNTSSVAHDGNISLALPTNSAVEKTITVSSNDHFIAGESYTLSFYSNCQGNNVSSVYLGSKSATIATSSGFVYNAVVNTYPNNYSNNTITFKFMANGNTCYIDNVKLEKGTVGTFYSEYGDQGKVYEKLIPDYLKEICYEDPYAANSNYKIKDNAPSQCFKYARLCNSEEIGCDLFTSVYGIRIGAKVLDKDYCSEQCVGYDVYVQKNTLFTNKTVAKFIPNSAQACSANAAGCTEFTNLDTVAAGGEGKEYYTYLRHCIKPDQGTCLSFYSWEGKEGSGYQLVSYDFEKDTGSLPKLTEGSLSGNNNVFSHQINGVTVCSPSIYDLPVSDPNYNSDCREFYDKAGQKYYALYSKTITCSNDCKTYKMTDKNIDTGITSSANCTGDNAHWDANLNVCYKCLGGGIWDDNQLACLYKAIPGEGQTCKAEENNCREYNGNSGNRVRIISSYDFSEGNLEDWTGSASISQESLNQGGTSIKISSGISKVEVGTDVVQGSSYIVKFLAKNTVSKNLSIYLSNGTDNSLFGVTGEEENTYSVTIPASGSWQLYQVSLDNLNHSVSNSESLNFKIDSGEMYVANVVLMEISSRYYLIKDSWTTPNICYYDTLGNYQGVNYNLSCQTYTNQKKSSFNLRQFSGLCDSSAVGCEMMIKTNNSNSPNSSIVNDTNSNGSCDSDEEDCIKTEVDRYMAVVYDSNNLCSAENKGCTKVGKIVASNPYSTGQDIYEDAYFKILPDDFSNNLCKKSEVGCDAWSAESVSGTSYFKDPGNNICQWRKGADTSSGYAWYKKAVNKCKSGNTFTSNVCKDKDDCLSGQTCELDNGDYLCPVELLKSIGSDGSPVYQPSADQLGISWAGLCPIAQAGCTEYVDPVSSFNPNLVLNPNFTDLDGDGRDFDNWTFGKNVSNCVLLSDGSLSCWANVCEEGSSDIKIFYQDIDIAPNKLYILETKGDQSAILKCSKSIFQLNNNSNTFTEISANNDFTVSPLSSGNQENSKKIFYSGLNTSCRITYSKPSGIEYNPGVCVPGQKVIVYSGSKNYTYNKSILDKIINTKVAEAETNSRVIEVREAIVDHQLKQNLNFTDCNSQADLSIGCILFNERSFSNATTSGVSSLKYNALNYSNYSNSNSNDANTLVKVSPNRICGKWLSCISYVVDENGEKTCMELGECTAFNSDGSCYNFTKSPQGVRSYTPGRDDNATGYSVLGLDYPSNMKQVGTDVEYYDFEDLGDINSKWAGSSITGDDGKNTTSCWINKPNNDGLKKAESKNVSYPASGKAFIKIKGACGDTSLASNSALTNLIKGNDYYFSALVNTSDIGDGEYVGIAIQRVTKPEDPAINEATYQVYKKMGWQEISFRFKYTGDLGIKIRLHSFGSSKPSYFDDVRIAPVLETVKSTTTGEYAPSICRLYPEEDSLLCKSESKNFIADGWYGYCLQKDPKNNNVCLLWYPIDMVKGEKGSGMASTAFTGYADSGGANPYYCAEMKADYATVEKRVAYYTGYDRCNCKDFDSNLDLFIGSENIKDILDTNNCKETSEKIPNCQSGYRPIALVVTDSCNNKKSDPCVAEMIYFYCAPIHQYDNPYVFCATGGWMGNNDYCVSRSYNGGEQRITKDSGNNVSASDIITYWKNNHAKLENSNWQIISPTDNMAISLFAVESQGWYKYDGFHTSQETNSEVKVYDYSSNTLLTNRSDYSPKCTKIVQGDIPWVQRLTDKSNNNKSVYDYGVTNPFFKNYKLGTLISPYGAIKTNGSLATTIYAGYNNTLADNDQYGLPYSCKNGSNGQVYVGGINGVWKHPCDALFLYFNNTNDHIYIYPAIDNSELSSNLSYSSLVYYDYRKALGHLFIKSKTVSDPLGASYIFSSYNFLQGVTIDGNLEKIQECPENESNTWCATYPTVSNIKLLNNLSINVNPDSQGKFNVIRPGFYFVTFNTNVNEEQTPISKLTLRVYKEGDDWTSDTGIKELDNLDAKPIVTNPHKIGIFLSSGTYQIMAKVVDNWAKFGCASSPSKDFGSGVCEDCCNNEDTSISTFKDDINCEACF